MNLQNELWEIVGEIEETIECRRLIVKEIIELFEKYKEE